MLVMKWCPVCGKAFEKTGNRQICCSKSCAAEMKRVKRLERERTSREARAVRIKCLTCGKEFVRTQKVQKCCCIQCKRKHDHAVLHEKRESNQKMKKCVVCCKEFRVLHGKPVVCSKECRRIHQNDLSRQRHARHAVHRFYKCDACGKVFQVVGHWYRYCPECRENGFGKAGRGGTPGTEYGLTPLQIKDVQYAQDRLPSDKLYEASQNWTPAQHKYALARWKEKHSLKGIYCFN